MEAPKELRSLPRIIRWEGKGCGTLLCRKALEGSSAEILVVLAGLSQSMKDVRGTGEREKIWKTK